MLYSVMRYNSMLYSSMPSNTTPHSGMRCRSPKNLIPSSEKPGASTGNSRHPRARQKHFIPGEAGDRTG